MRSPRVIHAFVRRGLRVHGMSLNARLHVLARFIAPIMCVAFVHGTRLRLRSVVFKSIMVSSTIYKSVS